MKRGSPAALLLAAGVRAPFRAAGEHEGRAVDAM